MEKVIIVSVHVRYFSFFSFFSLCLTGYVRLRQVTSGYAGYIRLRQFTSKGRDVELDNYLTLVLFRWRIDSAFPVREHNIYYERIVETEVNMARIYWILPLLWLALDPINQI